MTATPATWQRGLVAACAGVIGYCLTYVAVDYLKVPRLWHYQLERVYRVEELGKGPMPAGYVGLWTWAIVGGLVAAALGYGLVRLRKRPISEAGMMLALAWAMTAFVIAGGYFTWHNWP